MPLQLVPGNTPSTIDSGVPVTVLSGVTATQSSPSLTLAADNSAGRTNPLFTIQAGDARPRRLLLKGKGYNSANPPVETNPTTLSAALYTSDDNGASWQLFQTASALIATSVATDATLLDPPCSVMCQIIATSVTLGSAATVTVDAVLE